MANKLHKYIKMAGFKTEKEFYDRYPSEEDFFNDFPKARYGAALKKAGGGTTIQPTGDDIYQANNDQGSNFRIDVKDPTKAANWNPQGGVNLNNVFSGLTSIAAGALPYTPVRQNAPVLPQAINPNPSGIQGSRATFADGGIVNRDQWNSVQQQEFAGNNHSAAPGNQFLSSLGYNPNQLAGQQQDFLNLSKTAPFVVQSGAEGFSAADGHLGTKTAQQRYRPISYEHTNAQGITNKKSYGTNYEQAFAENKGNGQYFDTPQPIASNAPVSYDFSQKTTAATPVGNKAPTREQAIANYQAKKQGINQKWNGATGSYEATMAYGGAVPFANGGQLQVENDQFEMISPNTMKLKGNYHTDGGTDIAANGTEVEAERDETVHTDMNGDTVVGGNMKMPGTNTKFKEVFTKIGKMEQKAEKNKNKSAYFANNYDPHQKYTAPSFNTGAVYSDIYQREKQNNEQVKQYVTDVQQSMLDIAEATGSDPKRVSKFFAGKAKYGMTLPKADKRAVLKEQQQMIQEHPEWVEEAMQKYGKPKAGKFDDGLGGPRTDYVRNYIAQKKGQPYGVTAPQADQPFGMMAPQEFDGNIPGIFTNPDIQQIPVTGPQMFATQHGVDPISPVY